MKRIGSLRRCHRKPSTSKAPLVEAVHVTRSFNSGRFDSPKRSSPRMAFDRSNHAHIDGQKPSFGSDPEKLVQHAHEKERLAFRYALEQHDFPTAYRIYREYLDTRVLNAAEVTSLVQLISADALLRKHYAIEQPEALKTVLWQIVQDVKEERVAHQVIIWVFVFGALQTWGHFDQAHALWGYLRKLPMRSLSVKETQLRIDSRIYGAMIKLMVAEGRPLSECRALYQEVQRLAQYRPSLLLDEAMIRAHFSAGDIGISYKLMDKAIATHRPVIRSGFFNAIMGFAMDANAIGVATEVYMKACSLGMVVNAVQVGRLLQVIATHPGAYQTAKLIVKKYRLLNHGELPVEIINALLTIAFTQGGETETVLLRIRDCLQYLKEQKLAATTGTKNILLGGYIALGEEQLVQELLRNAAVDVTSYRTMLKSLVNAPKEDALRKIRIVWSMLETLRTENGTTMEARDLAMAMRASGHCGQEALDWAEALIDRYAPEIDDEAVLKLRRELTMHRNGTFEHRSKLPRVHINGKVLDPVVLPISSDCGKPQLMEDA